jgi:hypothetical protein
VRLESTIDEIHAAGAEVIALSANEDVRQAGMAERWKLRHITMVSDPGGERYLQAIGLFDPDERGGIAKPAMIVIGPDGSEGYRYNGRDFADRTTDDEVMSALRGLGLGPVDPGLGESAVVIPEDLGGFFPVANYVPYFNGNKFAAIAIGGRLDDEASKKTAHDHRVMAETSLDAWNTLNA